MKTIIQIALTELRLFFYSPVAWLMLVIFTFQAGMTFSDAYVGQLEAKALGASPMPYQTMILLTGFGSVFIRVLSQLYLYIPLLTMALMSREYSSGSIKLLYSSPVTNTQIIGGKYLCMMIYGLLLIGILILESIFSAFTVKDLDVSWVVTSLLGIYLLYCAYAAIGLFMSTLTHYQLVAAVGTLLLLTFLNYVGGMGQEIALVREITWWLSVAGRGKTFIDGMLGSENVIYFLVVIGMFVTLAVLALQTGKQHYSLFRQICRYGSVVGVALLIGFLTSRPFARFYWDATYIQRNTIPAQVQEFMKKIDGKLTFTMYVNLLDKNYYYGMPSRVKANQEALNPFLRFKPETKVKYVYYYDVTENPRFSGQMSLKEQFMKACDRDDVDPDLFLNPEEIRSRIDLSAEGNRVLYQIERENGQKIILRFFDDPRVIPSETEISAVLKRFVVKSPKLFFLVGHEERSIFRKGDDGYFTLIHRNFRQALVNQGFYVDTLSLAGRKEIPEDVDILAIVDPKLAFTPEEQACLCAYIARGGNLFIAGEPGRQEIMNELVSPLGVKFEPGKIQQNSLPGYDTELAVGNVTNQSVEQLSLGTGLKHAGYQVAMLGTTTLDYKPDNGFNCVTVLETPDTAYWHSFVGERRQTEEKAWPLMLALSRTVKDKEQRIIVSGDADLFSVGEMNMKRNNIQSGNFGFMMDMFSFLAYQEYPVDTRRPEPIDDAIYPSLGFAVWVKGFFAWGISVVLVVLAVTIWFRRRRK